MSTFYEFRMLNLPSRYRIKDNAQKMLKAYEDFKTGRIDETELGRQLRLSPENRAAVIQTMVQCAGIMGKKPEESKHCLAIIETCGEIVTIADKPPPKVGFPSFMKLPTEIRHRIYDKYLNVGQFGHSNVMIPQTKKGDCSCAPHEPPLSVYYRKNLNLAFTSKQMRDEVLSYFYKRFGVYFPCACEMGWHLRNNLFMREHIRKVKFHWAGPDADRGILELHKCSTESLIVVVSKLTTRHPNKREKEVQEYFARGQKSSMGLPEALGFEELSAIRGLQNVEVEHIAKKKAETRSSEDKMSLSRWLQAKLKVHRDDD